MTSVATEGSVVHELMPIGTACTWVVHPLLAGDTEIRLTDWLRIPDYVARGPRELTQIVRVLMETTGWSYRRLAEVVGTSHPTIGAIVKGRDVQRKPGLNEALAKTADVVARLSALLHDDQTRLNEVLQSRGTATRTPLDLLADGEYAMAYIAALDQIKRGRPKLPLKATHVRQPSQDLVALDEDDAD